ncbi:peptidylprolyl isomerase [Tomitella biformata]|uniref:peptidylprolyl isomerase n=1 Tax=Tomitella biformata TaxID=630403 RepID=UPI00046329D3|nr:peptidylprolyl isomerase [Tomitella biformata]
MTVIGPRRPTDGRSPLRWRGRVALTSAILLATGLALTGCGESAADSGPLNCSYPSTGDHTRPADKPTNLDVPRTGEVPLQLRTTAGIIDITLIRDGAPCAVHSFVSLLDQAYFVHTPCHRLTAPPAAIAVLQCGDPTGRGTGGPGYVVEDELPEGLEKADSAGSESSAVVYPRGTIALANRGVADSGGSQFFLVYQDSALPPTYSVLGAVDDASLPVLDAIAAAGNDGSFGSGDGRPVPEVLINAVDVRR